MNSLDDQFNRAYSLQAEGRLNDAAFEYRQILRKSPDHPAALSNLASVLSDLGQFEEAITLNRRALTLDPNLWQAHNNLANALKHTHDPDGALASYRDSIAIAPNVADTWSNYSTALKDVARLDEALEGYRHALSLNPHHAPAHSNLLFCLLYHRNTTTELLCREAKSWAAKFAPPPPPGYLQFKPHRNDRDPYRRLRIGYVGADFYLHAQSFFTVPLFEAHDKSKYEIHIFATQAREDHVTERIKTTAKRWHNVAALTDVELAAYIRSLHIDILVDLTMHMSGCRLPAFSLLPAPLQVTWLAYPGTTGLTTMQYRLTDPYLDPPPFIPNNPAHYTETSLPLSHTFWCYNPLSNAATTPDPAAQSSTSPFTFASLNNYCKTHPELLRAYAQILSQVPNSRLLLLSPKGSHRTQALKHFSDLNVDPTRVELISSLPREQYLALYRHADLALDTFPCNGHTTSLDALHMGTPVLTRTGPTALGRAGLSMLTNLGPEFSILITHNTEDFIHQAVQLATRPTELHRLKALLAERFNSCPLTDAPLFARSVENIYRTLWQQWCAT